MTFLKFSNIWNNFHFKNHLIKDSIVDLYPWLVGTGHIWNCPVCTQQATKNPGRCNVFRHSKYFHHWADCVNMMDIHQWTCVGTCVLILKENWLHMCVLGQHNIMLSHCLFGRKYTRGQLWRWDLCSLFLLLNQWLISVKYFENSV